MCGVRPARVYAAVLLAHPTSHPSTSPPPTEATARPASTRERLPTRHRWTTGLHLGCSRERTLLITHPDSGRCSRHSCAATTGREATSWHDSRSHHSLSTTPRLLRPLTFHLPVLAHCGLKFFRRAIHHASVFRRVDMFAGRLLSVRLTTTPISTISTCHVTQ
jgi:hypothetical protein